jgi:hypothetical protein
MIERILARYGYVKAKPHEFPRINNGDEAVSRGRRWEAFYSEVGGLADMIEGLRKGYFERVGNLKPGDTDGLQALAMADQIARHIDGQVRLVIESGKLAQSQKEHLDNVSKVRA